MCRLTADERQLRALAFPALDQLTLKRLLRQGAWLRLDPDTVLTEAGSPPERLYVVFDGQVGVRRDGDMLATVGPGHFVGEMAFITGAPASADTAADTAVRAFAWDQRALRQSCRRRPELREAIYSAIGPDLARKIADTSDRARAPRDLPEPTRVRDARAGRPPAPADGDSAVSGTLAQSEGA